MSHDLALMLFGLAGGMVVAALDDLAARIKRRRALPAPPPPPPPVNVFEGHVFPDPADPRWRGNGQEAGWTFGDSDIRVCGYPRHLYVGDVALDVGERPAAYARAITESQKAVRVARALEAAERALETTREVPDKQPDRAAPPPMALASASTLRAQLQQEQAIAMMRAQERAAGFRAGRESSLEYLRVQAANALRDGLQANDSQQSAAYARAAYAAWQQLYEALRRQG